MPTTDLTARFAELVRDEPDLPDLSRPAMAAGRRRRNARTAILGSLAAVAFAAAAVGIVAAPWHRLSHPVSGPSACTSADLSATFDGQIIRVHNRGSRACHLAGRYPVSIAWWHLNGPGPQPATGVLPAGGTYVQPFQVTARCFANLQLPIVQVQVPVQVENRTLHVQMTRQNAQNLVTCTTATALPPRIEH